MFRISQLRNLCNYLATTQSVKPKHWMNGIRALSVLKPSSLLAKQYETHTKLQNGCSRDIQLFSILLKYNKQSSQNDDLDDEDDDEDFKDERDSKVVKTKVNSLRADLILKAGLNMARNKVEVCFYDSKIRVNGKKIFKKSAQLNIGDEIDVVRGFSQTNPTHLVVSRVIILSANARDDDSIGVQLRRYKSLLIENYSGLNTYKSSDHQTNQ